MIWEENQTKYGSIKAVGFIRYLLKHGKWQWHKDVLNTQQKKKYVATERLVRTPKHEIDKHMTAVSKMLILTC